MDLGAHSWKLDDSQLDQGGQASYCNYYSATVSPASFSFVVPEAGTYSLQVTTAESRVMPYTIVATAAGATHTFDNVGTSYNFGKGIYLVNIGNTCADLRIESNNPGNYDYFNYFKPSDTTGISNVDIGCFSQPSAASISTAFTETGVYYMIPHSMGVSGLWTTSTVTINFNCYDAVCGNGIKEGSEECDNGNTVGCLDCVADAAYSCGGAFTHRCSCSLPMFDYDMISKQCIIHCEAVQYATIMGGNIDECECEPNYIFDRATHSCMLNCSTVVAATGPEASGTCLCQAGFYFSTSLQQCVINCTTVPHAIGYDLLISIDRCLCQDNYTFDMALHSCMNDAVVQEIQEEQAMHLTPVVIGLIIGLVVAIAMAAGMSIMVALRCMKKPNLSSQSNGLAAETPSKNPEVIMYHH